MSMGVPVALNLDGHSFAANSTSNPTTGSFIVDNDGNMYTQENASPVIQIDTATDWIRPADRSPGDYEVRYTSVTGDTANLTCTTAVDTWHPLSSGDWTITVSDTNLAVGPKSCTFTIEIRKGSTGSALVSGSYTLSADRTT